MPATNDLPTEPYYCLRCENCRATVNDLLDDYYEVDCRVIDVEALYEAIPEAARNERLKEAHELLADFFKERYTMPILEELETITGVDVDRLFEVVDGAWDSPAHEESEDGGWSEMISNAYQAIEKLARTTRQQRGIPEKPCECPPLEDGGEE